MTGSVLYFNHGNNAMTSKEGNTEMSNKTKKEDRAVKRESRAARRIKTELIVEYNRLIVSVGESDLIVILDEYPTKIQVQAGLMGLKNTIVDAAAGLTDEKEIVQAINARVEQLHTGTWSKRKPKVDWKAKYEATQAALEVLQANTEGADNGKV